MFGTTKVTTVILAVASIFFFADGNRFGKRGQETKQPMIVVDTVKVVSGYGSIDLNDRFESGAHNVAPSSSGSIYASIGQVLDDSTETVYYYGYVYKANERRLIIKSNGGSADTGKVAIQIILR